MSSNHLKPQPSETSGSSHDSVAHEKAETKRTNPFVRLSQALGFKKSYNFVLWFIFGGAMFGFALARYMYLNPSIMLSNIAPGEGYWFHRGVYRIGFILHIATTLTAGIIAITQFIPIIRYKAIIVHRILGYVSLFLLVVGTAAAFAIMRRSFGGDLSIQSAVVLLGAATLVSALLAWINIKRLQIDQHRKWMLRTWFYAGSIITVRLVMIIVAQIISAIGGYYTLWNCGEVLYALDNNSTKLTELYPMCTGGQLDSTLVPVPAVWSTGLTIGSTLRASFGAALWGGFLLHAVGVEVYIHLTPGEAARLRKVSYQRQLEAGMKYPGSMGTTSDRLGDNFGVMYKPE
ncbi:hypothetical protein BN14_07782 [Rhizoctonia solani AG-1 IB]|uniref:Uncharacterized protein n=1 Tax=Thanatephorus cucumeris (strain AG1-IB / isolate 7/3/14) TaxID=1108050 RepID=M5CCX6_THACB|nr:hypothetical protein BN14_07782 [Rhizoctonia solani AG-1 IB]